jgi:hypothetical protein
MSYNFEIEFFPLNRKMQPKIDNISLDKDSIVLVINYFGMTDIKNPIKNIKHNRPDIILIADHVQAYYDTSPEYADFTFNSYRKFLPIPEGADVITNNNCQNFQKPNDIEENTFSYSKIIGSILKYYGIEDRAYLSFFEKGEQILDISKDIYKATPVAQYLFEQLDHEKIKRKRSENAQYAYDKINKLGLEPLLSYNGSAPPAFIPILIENRDLIRKKLFSNNIFLPKHWPIPKKLSNINDIYYNKILSIIIDQRYSLDEIDYQIDSIKELLNK